MSFPFTRPFQMQPYSSYFIVRDAEGRTVAQGSERTCLIAMGEPPPAVQGAAAAHSMPGAASGYSAPAGGTPARQDRDLDDHE